MAERAGQEIERLLESGFDALERGLFGIHRLRDGERDRPRAAVALRHHRGHVVMAREDEVLDVLDEHGGREQPALAEIPFERQVELVGQIRLQRRIAEAQVATPFLIGRSEEHTSELPSLMRISYAVFCFKKKKHITQSQTDITRAQISQLII